MSFDAHHEIHVHSTHIVTERSATMEVITSCKRCSSWWLPLTWLTATRSAVIVLTSFSNGDALQMMRKLASPSKPPPSAVTSWTAKSGAFKELELDSVRDAR